MTTTVQEQTTATLNEVITATEALVAEVGEENANRDAAVASTAADAVSTAADLAAIQGLKASVDTAASAAASAIVYQNLAGESLNFSGADLATCFGGTAWDSNPNWSYENPGLSWCKEERATGNWLGEHASASAAITAGGVDGDYYLHTDGQSLYKLESSAGVEIFRAGTANMPEFFYCRLTASRVIIHDLTQPGAPVWMIFSCNTGNMVWLHSAGVNTSIAYKEGVLCTGCNGSDGGVSYINFLTETRRLYYRIYGTYDYLGDISQRNYGSGHAFTGNSITMISSAVNSIDMAVMDFSPIDPLTGLRKPMIVVATDSGLTFIDGPAGVDTAIDQTHSSYGIIEEAKISERGDILYTTDSSATGTRYTHVIDYGDIPTVDVAHNAGYDGADTGEVYTTTTGASYTNTVFHWHTDTINGCMGWNQNGVFLGRDLGLLQSIRSAESPLTAPIALLGHDYNTGWMPNAVKGAWQCGTDTTSHVSGVAINTNHDFSSGGTGWTTTGSPTWTFSGGTATADSSVSPIYAYQTFTIGRQVKITIVIDSISTGVVGFSLSSGAFTQSYTSAGTYTYSGPITTNGTVYIRSDFSDAVISSFLIEDLHEDYSQNFKGLKVNGTIAAAAVSSGSDFILFGPYSSANYLEQDYNSDMDVGTGDFTVIGFVKNSSHGALFHRVKDKSIGAFGAGSTSLGIYMGSAGALSVKVADGSTLSVTSLPVGQLMHVVVTRVSGVLKIYIDGDERASAASTEDMSHASATTTIGGYWSSNTVSSASFQTSKVRFAASGLSADMVKKIAKEDMEMARSVPNQASTLYGSSSYAYHGVYDPVTKLTTIGTTSGNSTFDGLVRTSYSTNTSSTRVNAFNGVILTE